MRRVSVVGNTGAGKTRLARRLAERLGVPHIELDAIHHLPGWVPLDQDSFLTEIDSLTSDGGWVVDGNHRTVVVDGPVWRRADTVVWLDLPRRMIMYQVITRTVRRVARREELWNGNREPFRNLYAWDPYESIIRWAWTQHSRYQQRYGSAMSASANAHLQFVHLRSRGEIDHWLAGLDHHAEQEPSPRRSDRADLG